jgi:hypothetical protein
VHSQRFWWHICIFFPTHLPTQKKSKRATKPTHQNSSKQWTKEQRQTERQHLTAPTQKAGFRVPKTVLWLIIRQGGFQIKFCGKSPALRVAAKRWL